MARRASLFLPAGGMILALFMLVATPMTDAEVYERCTLAKLLVDTYGLPRSQINTWMCIAYRESRYDSSHINYNPSDGSRDYGLFQINNRYWCTNNLSPAPNQNLCGVTCDTVLNSLPDTVKCIKTMYAKSKNTWQPWITYPPCLAEGDLSKYTAGCTF